MNLVAEVALWSAFVSAAWRLGVLLSRPRGGNAHALPGGDMAAVACAAALVLAWAALAGALLRADASLALVLEGTPVSGDAFGRLAALWATVRGGTFSAAVGFALADVAASSTIRSEGAVALAGVRRSAAFSFLTVTTLAASLLIWFPLAAAGEAATPRAVPVHLTHLSAALAPLFALAALVTGVAALIRRVTTAAHGAPTGRQGLLAAWLLATLAIAAEQVARSRVGLTTGDAVVLGSSSSGLVLWLVLSALVHERVGALVAQLVTPAGARRASHSRDARRWPAHLAHAGAALVVLSFAAHIAARRSDIVLPSGQGAEAQDAYGRPWHFVNQGLSRFDSEGTDVQALAVDTRSNAGATRLLTTERRQRYGRTGEPLGAAIAYRASWPGMLQDVRLVLADAEDGGDTVRVRVSFVPFAWGWQAGILLLLVGGLASLRRAPREASGARPSQRASED